MKNLCFALMCFLCCPYGVLFGTSWEKRIKVILKVGENVTLQVPVNDSAVGEIQKVIWTKGSNTFLEISNKNNGTFLNKTYESIICSYNISSITICNATGNNTGFYVAHIRNKSKDPKWESFYVAEDPHFCDGTTNRHEIEGDTVNLPVKKDPAEHSWWSKNNINANVTENPELSKYDNGSLSIRSVRKEDEGNYTVHVKKNFPLNPLCDHTYILSISPSRFCGKTTNVQKIEGDTVNLPVKGRKSAGRCRWSRNNINVTSSDIPKLSIYDNGTLSINNLTKEDEGNYTVMNERNECSHTYILSVSSGDNKGVTPSYQIGIIVFGIAAAVMTIAVIAVCVYRKKIRQRRTRRNPDPPREENRHQEMVALNPNPDPNR